MNEAVQRVSSSIPRRQIRSPRAPLAYAQERLWTLYQLDPLSSAFNLAAAVRLEGKLDVAALKRALAAVVRRQEVLRTTFDVTADGHPFQSVHPSPSYWPLPLADLTSLPDLERDAEVRRLVAVEAIRPFNLQTGPTFRTSLICSGPSEHVLLLSLHHIIADDCSIVILIREISVLYEAFVAGAPPPLTNLPVQYTDFAVWQRRWPQEEVAPALSLPSYFPHRVAPSFCEELESVSLDEELTAQLKELSQREGATVSLTLFTVFQILLHHYSGQRNILIGTSIANRDHGSTENLIGLFANNIVLRSNLSGNPTFRELLGRAHDVTFDAEARQDEPLFQAMLVFENDPLPTTADGLKLSLLDSTSETSNFDLVLHITETDQRLSGDLHYNKDLFAAHTITPLLDRFQNLLHTIAADPDARIDSLC